MPTSDHRNGEWRQVGGDPKGDGGGLLVGAENHRSHQREAQRACPQGQLPRLNSPSRVNPGHLHVSRFPSSAPCLLHCCGCRDQL